MRVTTFCLISAVILICIKTAVWGYESDLPNAETAIEYLIWFLLGGYWMITLGGKKSS